MLRCCVSIVYAGKCKPVECHSDAKNEMEITVTNDVTETATDSVLYDMFPLQHDLNSQQQSSDNTVITDCSGSQDMVDNSSAIANQLQVKKKCKTFGKNNSAAKRKSPRAKTVKQKQTHDKTQIICCSCNRTFSPCGDLMEQCNSLTEQSICPHCQHASSSVVDLIHGSEPSETVIKTEDIGSDVCSTVDTVGLSSSVTAVNSEQSDRDELRLEAVQASNSVDGRNSPIWHQCGVCCHRFATAMALHQHERVHVDGKSYSAAVSCRTCGKKFRHRYYLRYHERLHDTNERPFVCDVCGKGFLMNSNLTTHRRSHSGDRPYACSVCHKRFFQLCAVRDHEKIHIGVKMFVCDVCGKQFLTSAQLYNHSRTHGGEKAFECGTCCKRFYTNGDLAKHARIHADLRPFVCDVCGKGFKYSSNLHGHARIHSGSRPFECRTCGKAFMYSSHLTRHAKMHARNDALLDDRPVRPTAEEQTPPPATTQSTDTAAVATPAAILLVRPELLLGGTQMAASLMSGVSVSPYSAHLTVDVHNHSQ